MLKNRKEKSIVACLFPKAFYQKIQHHPVQVVKKEPAELLFFFVFLFVGWLVLIFHCLCRRCVSSNTWLFPW